MPVLGRPFNVAATDVPSHHLQQDTVVNLSEEPSHSDKPTSDAVIGTHALCDASTQVQACLEGIVSHDAPLFVVVQTLQARYVVGRRHIALGMWPV